MGIYFDPPDQLPKQGRRLVDEGIDMTSLDLEYWHKAFRMLDEQLEEGEHLFCYVVRRDTPFNNALWLGYEREKPERWPLSWAPQYQEGNIIHGGFFAVKSDVAEAGVGFKFWAVEEDE